METLATLADTGNIAETLARELKKPEILTEMASAQAIIGLPPGWKAESIDLEKLLSVPRRKIAKIDLTETESFTDYIIRHGSLANCTIYCTADFKIGNLGFTAILNDHGAQEHEQHWRDHRATYTPVKSEEWTRWTEKHERPFTQTGFARFLEENLKDISTSDGMPKGTDMLAMATAFEAKQDMRFKSAVRLQSGGVRMEYIADEDKNTVEAMQVFEKFQIAIPVFRADVARYPITARLRYRVKDGALVFWYELIRSDLVMEQASRALVESVRAKAGMPFYFGTSD